MHTFLPRFPQLRAPLASGGLRQDDLRRIRVARQRGHGGQGSGASGPAATAPGAAGRPAAVPNLGETRSPAAGASPAASVGAPGTTPSRRATCWRESSRRPPTDAEQPQRRDGDGQPRRAAWSGALIRVVPLPARALRDLKALFDPRPQAIPARLTGLRCQIGQEQPGGFVAVFPARQQGAGHLVARKGRPVPRQRLPGCGASSPTAASRAPCWPKAAARIDAQERMPAQAHDPSKQPRRIQPPDRPRRSPSTPAGWRAAAGAPAAATLAARRVWRRRAGSPRPRGWHSRDRPH